jgi:hypothetical protein
VATFVIVTVASGTAAPLASVTVPLILPRPCRASPGDARRRKSSTAAPSLRTLVNETIAFLLAEPMRPALCLKDEEM